jgi:Grx4 family monothiol glutaredoxin
MHQIFQTLSEKYSGVDFYTVEAEAVVAVSERMNVSVVPSFYAIVNTTVLSKVEGVNPADLSKLVKMLHDQPLLNGVHSTEVKSIADNTDLAQKLSRLLHIAPVVLFMKGSPDVPRCGFSRQIVAILKQNDVPFATFDILSDEDVRQGLKIYSDWPTYPQLYVNGALIGGLDIVKEMAVGGDLKEHLGVTSLQLPPPPLSIEERLKSLINQAQVMVFIKGTPDSPKCGFSKTIVSILREHGVGFATFDILSDEDVRQGLKIYSDWPTYPQLYVNGALIGGLDIVKEMAEGGDLKEQMGLL